MDGGVLKCKNCGASINLSGAVDGVVQCEYCHSIFTVPKKEIDPSALSFLRMGEHNLDTCKFDDAYTAYKKAAELDSNEPEAYFGMALAEFKVQYLKDTVKNRLQPICHGFKDKVFTENKNYKNALKCASPKQREEYEKKAKEIDYIRGEFLKLKQSGLDYDCFICTKVTREGSTDHTEDSHIAGKLFRELKNAGYAPFYSEEEVRNRTGADYEALILYALYCSKSMIVVCCNEEYLNTPWVKNEYTRYLSFLSDGEKQSDSITIVFKGAPIERLPGRVGKIEGINYGEGDAMLRVLSFVGKFKKAALPEIQRKEYKGASYTKKNIQRQGVTKRQLTTVSGGEITVSARAKMNIAAEFLARRNFANAIRQCETILSENPANSETHWMLFLAQHRCVNNNEYIYNYSGASNFDHLEKAIASASDEGKKEELYFVLYNRVKERKDIEAYKEYIILPDSTEQHIAELTEIMYNCAIGSADANIFREIIKTVTDTDKYISMNLGFAEKVPEQAAVEFYKNVLSADEGHAYALYKVFAAEHGFSAVSVFDYCCKKENFKDIEDKLYAYGYNDQATLNLFSMCLLNADRYPEESSCLFDFVLSVIPKNENKIFENAILKYIDKLLESGKLSYAQKYNELLLASDNLSHDAYFNRVLIKNGFTNPLELVKISDTLMDDSDFFSAVNSYTEKNPQKTNLYLDINDAVKELSRILNTTRRREQAIKNVRVDKKELLNCKDKVLKSTEVADHTGTKFGIKQSIKVALFNVPTLILFAFALAVVFAPQLIFKYIHYGFVIGILILGFAILLIISLVTFKKNRAKNGYQYAHVKQRTAIMLAGACAFAILLGCGLGFVHKNTYHLKEAEDFKLLRNLPTANHSTFIIDKDIDFKGKDYGMGCLWKFYGTIDGKGHVLSNIKYSYKNYASYGLVCYNYGVVKNLTIKNSEFGFGTLYSNMKLNNTRAIIVQHGSVAINCSVTNCKVIVIEGSYKKTYDAVACYDELE